MNNIFSFYYNIYLCMLKIYILDIIIQCDIDQVLGTKPQSNNSIFNKKWQHFLLKSTYFIYTLNKVNTECTIFSYRFYGS